MDLTKLNIMELWKLYYQLSFEMFKRIWWIIIIIFAIGFIITYLQITKGNITRSGSCKECGKHNKFKSNFEVIANIKFNVWLYKHYKEEHNTNIVIGYIKNKFL